MKPWHLTVTLRKEVREGRSFNPDEFAIHLEQVVAGTAPEDYKKPEQFFARTCFTRALREHAGMVLRRLAGKTDNTAPVLTLVTQFGGGKTHTLTTLYHLARLGGEAGKLPGIPELLNAASLAEAPAAKPAVFVGNAWDPQPGRETPWIDLARQLAGDRGVALLGEAAKTTPPGTETLGRVFEAAGQPVLLLFDEVLNFVNRHRDKAEQFYAFLQNLTVAATGTTRGAAVISLPRSQVEMTEWDQEWQDKINKIVRRVAKDLIANDEAEIGEVIRRRLFEDLGPEKTQQAVCKRFADWCFERRAQLPSEWTAVDTATTEQNARAHLQERFASCYPFHPATLSVFQRKWNTLPQYQQTRGTLAMLAQWTSVASRDHFEKARHEELITLGSAPLELPEFRSVVLGQLGEPKLATAIETDIAGKQSHARALDIDTSGPLRDIHRRVGTAIFFESSGGQAEKVAHLPELRFALCEPQVDTTSVDNAALALNSKAFYISPVGSDGFRIRHQATLKKVVNDRRASLDPENEIKPNVRAMVEKEFQKGAGAPLVFFPKDGSEVADSPRLTLVVVDPELEWGGSGPLRGKLAEWTRQRGTSNRLYPAAIVWCCRKPGRDLREKVETTLAWRRVARELADGTLGPDYDQSGRSEVGAIVKATEEDARDEVWASYRYVVIADPEAKDGLREINLGAGHSSGSETLMGRVVQALKTDGLLNESVGAGFIERHWPPALKTSGAWPLASLRQSFLNGALPRLPDADAVLRGKIVEFVGKGDFAVASGQRPDGTYERIWFEETISPDEVTFEPGVFLLLKSKATELRAPAGSAAKEPREAASLSPPDVATAAAAGHQGDEDRPSQAPDTSPVTIHVVGEVPIEQWNRVGTKLVPKLRAGESVTARIELTAQFKPESAEGSAAEIRQVIEDLGLRDSVRVNQR